VGGNQKPFLSLYKSLVLPVLDYCSPAWYVYKKGNIADLEGVQRRATRMILRQKRQEMSYENRLQQLELPSLTQRRDYFYISFMCKQLSGQQWPSFLNNVSINPRYDTLTFKHNRSRTNVGKYATHVLFPKMWSDIPVATRDKFLNGRSFSSFKHALRSFYFNM